MKQLYEYAFIGIGNMASAIMSGMHTDSVLMYARRPESYAPFAHRNFGQAESIPDAVTRAKRIVLTVKPQNFEEILTEIRESGVSLAEKTFVSVAAGISTGYICRMLGQTLPVVRTMPNTPLLCGKGVTALSRNEWVSDEEFAAVSSLFSSCGSIICLPEEQMNAIISVNGSSPAYVYLMIDAMIQAAAAQGFAPEAMRNVVCDVLIGAAEMVRSSDKTPAELIRAVTSPNGTTERAMKVLDERDFRGMMQEAMLACTARADELSETWK